MTSNRKVPPIGIGDAKSSKIIALFGSSGKTIAEVTNEGAIIIYGNETELLEVVGSPDPMTSAIAMLFLEIAQFRRNWACH